MTIHENKKSLITVKDIDSDLISEAYFVLKTAPAEYDERKMTEEAERILRECESKKKSRRILPAALCGFLFGSALCAFIVSFALLCIKLSQG